MASELENMLRTQMQSSLNYALDSAVQAGDIAAARKATQQLFEFNKAQGNSGPKFTNADIRSALKDKAPWFGVDPRRSARAVEFGKNMEPESFKSADAFAEKIVEEIEKEFEEEDEPEAKPVKVEDNEDEDEDEKKPVRRKTDAPSGNMSRAVPRRSSGPWVKLSDAPREVADQIKASADKFTRNATKEQREKYLTTALGAAYQAAQRAKK